MNHTDSPETVKNPKKNKDAGKSPQELYDKYIRKGDEAIISEDIILAEKYYQHADYYLRCLNDPHHCGNAPGMQPSSSPSSRAMADLIAKALKGIVAERAARQAAFKEKIRGVVEASKAARLERNKDKSEKAKAAPCKRTAQRKGKIQTKGMDKKPGNRDEPCKIIPLNPAVPSVDVEQQTRLQFLLSSI